MFAQTSLLPQEEKETETKTLLVRMDKKTKQRLNSKLHSQRVSQQRFFEKCIELFLDGTFNPFNHQEEMNNILDIKKKVKEEELTHRVDVKLPLDLYNQICDLAEQNGEPINHLSGKPVTQRVIVELLKIGLRTVEEGSNG